MKKLIAYTCVLGIAFSAISCKKEQNQPADQLVTEAHAAEVDGHDHAEHAEEPVDLAKEAQNKPLTNLVLSEDFYDFGNIKKGESVEHKYEVTNTGKNPLVISNVKPGCGCTAPDFTKDPILPGQKGFIVLKFDSSNFDGNVQKQAEVFANVEKVPITIGFTGNIIP